VTLKIGLIGCGGITVPHVEAWRKVAGPCRESCRGEKVSEENAKVRVAQIGHQVRGLLGLSRAIGQTKRSRCGGHRSAAPSAPAPPSWLR